MESEKELKEQMEAYPHKLNKYIHQEARGKLLKMGVIKKSKVIKEEKTKPPVVESNTDEFKKLKALNMTELKEIAKSKGLVNYSSLREDDLIKLILSKK